MTQPRILSLIILLISVLPCALAQVKPDSIPSPGGLNNETLKQANNPMANLKSFNVQNYAVSRIYGTDMTQNQLLLRFAQPAGRFLIRATLPFITVSMPQETPTFGMGDFNVFAIYSLAASKGNQFGIGPLLTAPTATSDVTGAGKWQAGFAALAFFANSQQIQLGSLLQYQTSFAGDEDRPDVGLLTAQVFFIWQIGGGYYLRSTGIWSFNLEDLGNYNVPLGLGLGKVVKVGKLIFNIFAEPQVTVMAEGYNQPKFQTFFGINAQF